MRRGSVPAACTQRKRPWLSHSGDDSEVSVPQERATRYRESMKGKGENRRSGVREQTEKEVKAVYRGAGVKRRRKKWEAGMAGKGCQGSV